MESLEIRRSWLPFVSILLVGALLAAWALHELREGDLVPELIYLVGVLWAVAMLVRHATTPFARLQSQGITYYGDMRTRSVDWDAIERVELRRSHELMVLARDARPVYLPLRAAARSQREVLLQVMKERLEGSLTSASS